MWISSQSQTDEKGKELSSEQKEATSLNTAYSESREQKRSDHSSSGPRGHESDLQMREGVFSPRD
jgi:hypothetical protein